MVCLTLQAQVIALHQAPRDELATMRKRINQELDEISRSAALHEEESDAELAHVAESLASSWGPRAATNMLANTNIDPQPRREWWEVLMGSDPRKSGRNSRSPSPGDTRSKMDFNRSVVLIQTEGHVCLTGLPPVLCRVGPSWQPRTRARVRADGSVD